MLHFGTYRIGTLRADSSWGGQYQRLNYSLILLVSRAPFEDVRTSGNFVANVNGKRPKLARLLR